MVRKKYSRPRKPFDSIRIQEEGSLKEKYGLKNKREIWKSESAINKIRNKAKSLITGTEKEKNEFIEKLQKKGFQVESIADILALSKEDILKRRLQTIVFSKNIANTPKQARQFITHKHISIDNEKVNIPSYQVDLEEESSIKLDIELPIKKQEKTKVEEIKESIENE